VCVLSGPFSDRFIRPRGGRGPEPPAAEVYGVVCIAAGVTTVTVIVGGRFLTAMRFTVEALVGATQQVDRLTTKHSVPEPA